MILNVGAGGATDADKIKYGDSNVADELNSLDQSVSELDESLEELKELSVYSSEEQLIGTWFNKPLYRKCYEVTNVNVNEAQIPHNIDNLDNIVKIDGTYWADNFTQCFPLGLTSQASSEKWCYGCSIYYRKSANNLATIGLWGGSGTNYNVDKISFEVLYTKTN